MTQAELDPGGVNRLAAADVKLLLTDLADALTSSVPQSEHNHGLLTCSEMPVP
jgi:hypothetical protein